MKVCIYFNGTLLLSSIDPGNVFRGCICYHNPPRSFDNVKQQQSTLPAGMIEVVISHSRMNVSSFIVAGKRNLNSFIVLYMPQ